jgi:hypothetical protein
VTTARLHVIGSAHEARYGESFDGELAAALDAAQDPARAAVELDELGLLGALAFYAAAGADDPDDPAPDWWGLETDPLNPRVRRHHYTVHYTAARVDVFVFSGFSVTPEHTIVGSVSLRPEALT